MSYVGIVDTGQNDNLVASSVYGACSTAADVAAKVVVLNDFDALMNGVTIQVKFVYSNTASNPTMNVNNTGAKPIYLNGTNPPGATALLSWSANSVMSFTYDGTAWIMNDVNKAVVDAVDRLNAGYNPVSKTSGMTKAVGNDSEGKLWTEPVEASEVQTAANTWLTANITNPDSPPLDRSLSSNASAAPADMVGDLKNTLKDSLNEFSMVDGNYNTLSITPITGSYAYYHENDAVNGDIYNFADYAYVMIAVKPRQSYKITTLGGAYVPGAVFYSSTTPNHSNLVSVLEDLSGNKVYTDYEITIPDNVWGMVVNTRNYSSYPIAVKKLVATESVNRLMDAGYAKQTDLETVSDKVDRNEIEVKRLQIIKGNFVTVSPDTIGDNNKYVYAVSSSDINNGTVQNGTDKKYQLYSSNFIEGDRFCVTTSARLYQPPVVFFSGTTVDHANYLGALEFPQASKDYNDFVFTIPSGVKMFAVNTSDYSAHPITVKKYTAEKTISYLSDLDIMSLAENPLEYIGKEVSVFNKILCIGDSLTHGVADNPGGVTPDSSHATRTVTDSMYSYPTFLEKMYGIETVTKATGGITSSEWITLYGGDDLTGCDCAVIFLGSNDHKFVTQDGMTAEQAIAQNETNIRSIINLLQTANYGIPVFVCTLLPYFIDANGVSVGICENIRNFVNDVPGVYCIDLNKYTAIKHGTAYENLHPTAIGYQKMAEEIGSAISYSIANNPSDFKWIRQVGTAYAVPITN